MVEVEQYALLQWWKDTWRKVLLCTMHHIDTRFIGVSSCCPNVMRELDSALQYITACASNTDLPLLFHHELATNVSSTRIEAVCHSTRGAIQSMLNKERRATMQAYKSRMGYFAACIVPRHCFRVVANNANVSRNTPDTIARSRKTKSTVPLVGMCRHVNAVECFFEKQRKCISVPSSLYT